MERDILHKHKTETGVKNLLQCSFYTIFNFSFNFFYLDMTFCVTCIYFGHISLPSLKNNTRIWGKTILEFAFKIDLSIKQQKHATAWSDKHIRATCNKCYNNIFPVSPATICMLKYVKISWYKLNVSSVAETMCYYRQYHQTNKRLRCKYMYDNNTQKMTRTSTFEIQSKSWNSYSFRIRV
jgi:hypothetical protein